MRNEEAYDNRALRLVSVENRLVVAPEEPLLQLMLASEVFLRISRSFDCAEAAPFLKKTGARLNLLLEYGSVTYTQALLLYPTFTQIFAGLTKQLAELFARPEFAHSQARENYLQLLRYLERLDELMEKATSVYVLMSEHALRAPGAFKREGDFSWDLDLLYELRNSYFLEGTEAKLDEYLELSKSYRERLLQRKSHLGPIEQERTLADLEERMLAHSILETNKG